MNESPADLWRPLADVATARKLELGVSFRELERRTKELDGGRGMSAGYLVQMFNGNEDPVPRTIRLIAGALEMSAEDFIEYRLHALRQSLDERLNRQKAVESYVLIESLAPPEVMAHLAADTPNADGGRQRYAAAS